VVTNREWAEDVLQEAFINTGALRATKASLSPPMPGWRWWCAAGGWTFHGAGAPDRADVMQEF
jgi:RNA polymerase sigma-70 factor (ECF subfamily)